jgi:hypothetical protein
MAGREEKEIQSVFEHWASRNKDDMPYGEMKQRVDERGMSVNRMAAEMDWAYFAPLTREETFDLVNSDSEDTGSDYNE